MPNEELRVLGRAVVECTNRSDGGLVSIWRGARRGGMPGSTRLHHVPSPQFWHVTTHKGGGARHTAVEPTLVHALFASLVFLTGEAPDTVEDYVSS